MSCFLFVIYREIVSVSAIHAILQGKEKRKLSKRSLKSFPTLQMRKKIDKSVLLFYSSNRKAFSFKRCMFTFLHIYGFMHKERPMRS